MFLPMASSEPRPEPTPLAAATAPFFNAARLLSSNLAALRHDEQTMLVILAGIIGSAVGFGVSVFYRLIDLVQDLVLRSALRIPVSDLLLIPLFVAAGLAACRWLGIYGARGSTGENIPDVMYRVSVKGGVIPLMPVLAKTVAAAVVIGTGGSVGAEGPVVVLGAGTASKLGRWMKASPNRLRTLAGCGAAAGLSAAFNAPIAGVIFGIEKITGTAGGMALAPYVVGSILAATVSRGIFGNRPVLQMPSEFGVHSPWEMILYAVLGLVCGIVSVLYSRGVWRAQDLFAKLRSPWMRIALGALVIGALDLMFRQDLWGHGHQSLNLGIVAARSGLFLLGLTAAKLIATAVTFGAGGTGGVFTPALFIGATLGGAFGVVAQHLFPSSPVLPGAMALVGMAGLVAGATHAPLTAIFMVFEMTGDYALILPLMLTSVLAYMVSRRLYPESIYTEWLVRRGVVLSQGADAVVLARATVADCYHRDPITVPAWADVRTILELTRDSRQTEFPVVSVHGRLVGMLSRETVRELDIGTPLEAVLATDLARLFVKPVTPEDSLLTAMRRLGAVDVDYLPVVSVRDHGRLVGLVGRHDLTAAYDRLMAEEAH
jgi:CIC family chloride channel protein